MLLLLTCLLAAAPGELKVYRSAQELPPALAQVLPAGFDFRSQMMATRTEVRGPVVLVVPQQVVRRGDDLVIRERARSPARPCPPCLGIEQPPTFELPNAPVLPAPVFLLPRVKGAVFEEPAEAAPSPICPVCRAG